MLQKSTPTAGEGTRRVDPFLMSVLKSRFEAIVRWLTADKAQQIYGVSVRYDDAAAEICCNGLAMPQLTLEERVDRLESIEAIKRRSYRSGQGDGERPFGSADPHVWWR
jgi:hypothetical protein